MVVDFNDWENLQLESLYSEKMIQDVDGLDSRKFTVITASRLVLEKNTSVYNSKRQTLNTIGRREGVSYK